LFGKAIRRPTGRSPEQIFSRKLCVLFQTTNLFYYIPSQLFLQVFRGRELLVKR